MKERLTVLGQKLAPLHRLKKQKKPHGKAYHDTIAFLNKYSLIFHFLLACVLVYVIETISRRNFAEAAAFTGRHTIAYLYNALIVFATLSPVYLTKFRAQLRMLISGVWIFLGTVNGLILSNRVTPFSYTDLKCINDLLAMQNTTYFTAKEGTIAVAAIALFLLFLLFLFVKGPRYQGKRHRILTPVSVAALLLVGLPVTTQAAQNSNIVASYFANIAQGYSDYGFVYGFSTSVVGRGMGKPADYSEETVSAITTLVDSASRTTHMTAEKQPNIICVLLESFVDPYDIDFLSMSEDPVPNFHELERDFSSGYLKVPVVGAGTANTEFEILSGMSMRYFGTGEYPYKTILKQTDCESIASDLSKIGYGTHVVHNNTATFYSRNNAFSMMGFDSFTSKELMNITQYTPTGSWPTDDVLVSETIKSMDSTEGPDFVYTITVEGHGDYPKEKVLTDPAIRVTGAADEASGNQWEYYVNMLHEVDDFIGDLVKAANRRGEDTIIVFFGDHLPTLGLSDENMKSGDIFQTKYITWNNMGLAKEDADLTAYQLLAHITDQAGIHEGTIFRYHQTQAESETYLSGLETLQYDLLYGKRYAYGGEDLYPASELMMDVEDVTISSARKNRDGQTVSVYGSGFTKNTKVFVNGNRISTQYVTRSLIRIDAAQVTDGDILTVNILGSKGILLRAGIGEVIYEDPDVFRDTEEPSEDQAAPSAGFHSEPLTGEQTDAAPDGHSDRRTDTGSGGAPDGHSDRRTDTGSDPANGAPDRISDSSDSADQHSDSTAGPGSDSSGGTADRTSDSTGFGSDPADQHSGSQTDTGSDSSGGTAGSRPYALTDEQTGDSEMME